MRHFRLLSCVVLLLSSQISFCQKSNYYDNYSFQHNNTNGTIRTWTAQNFQFLDNPFFKFKSSRNSEVTFLNTGSTSFGLEITFPKPIFRNTYFMFGLYYEQIETKFSRYSKSQYLPNTDTISFNASSIVYGDFIFISVAGGIYHEYNLTGRMMLSLSSSINIGTFKMDDFSKDTLGFNAAERVKPVLGEITLIKMPPKIYASANIRLKNEAMLSYYVSKTAAFNLGFAYNLGLPNKAFDRSFYIYKTNDLSRPVSYEKAVYSTSSMEILFGMSFSL